MPSSPQQLFSSWSHQHIVNVIPESWWLKYPETDLTLLVKQSNATYGSGPIQNQPESSHFLMAYNIMRQKEGKKSYTMKPLNEDLPQGKDGNARTL